MVLIPYLIAYLGIAVFAVAVILRFMRWTRMPMHLRWELYPIAHEAGKAQYGGSYLEESEWWNKKREFSLIGEVKAMFLEIVFLVALKEYNRPMWTWSFPFHFGLYLVIGATALIFLNSLLLAFSPGLLAGALGSVLSVAISILGLAGLVLSIIGAAGLLYRRLAVPELKDYSAPADFFNLVLFVIIMGIGLVGFLVTYPGFFPTVSRFLANMIRLDTVALPGTGISVILPIVSVVLMSMLLAYIPLTHMSHFIGKYFAYHSIRWNDTPNLPGSGEESTIQEALGRPVSWAAPHIRGEGKKTWADVATQIPEDEEVKK
jgi:nitrate reductase gamma subunit